MSMNSSAGFKKRSLLRPPSGMLSNQRQFLKCIDISQSEPILASNIRTEVASIQEQINLLDNDKRIRTGQASLEKGYVLSMRKWLTASQSMIEKQDDDIKILKHMGVDNYEKGFRKMWKLLSHLDLIVSKVTELEIISFLKYDQMFSQMAQDSPFGAKILQKIAKTGFNPSNFHPSQLILQRNQQLFSVATKYRRQQPSLNSSKGFSKQTKDDTNQLIEQLRQQNTKLVSLLEQMEQNQKNKQNDIKKIPNSIPNSPESIFNQVQAKYKQQITELNEKIHHLNKQISELKITAGNQQVKLKTTEQQIRQLKKGAIPSQKPVKGSYEQALLEEMNKMKSGFQRKIQRMIQEYSGKERQMRKKQYQYKNQNDRIKWQKGLLLKKFEAISS